MSNEEVALTLDEAVQEVLGQLTGLDLTYDPRLDRYRAIVRQLNKALRLNALEKEWSYYASTRSIGQAVAGVSSYFLPSNIRPRQIGDDAVRLVQLTDDGHEHIIRWAYFMTRDALPKHEYRQGLWAAVVRQELMFSRPLAANEDGLDIQLPVMREPYMFRLPEPAVDTDPNPVVPADIRNQEVDFVYPDLITMRAAALYAATDPVMQPRVQTLEAMHTDLRYQIQEREDRNTDSPFMNEWFVPIENSINGGPPGFHGHPHADERMTL